MTDYIQAERTNNRLGRMVGAPLKVVLMALLCWRGVALAADSNICPPGEPIQWIADYCMAKIGTDDEVAASDCIAAESKIMFRSECTAKLYFKRALCEVLVRAGTRSGTVDACVADPQFVGDTVRNGGVGGQPAAPADAPPEGGRSTDDGKR